MKRTTRTDAGQQAAPLNGLGEVARNMAGPGIAYRSIPDLINNTLDNLPNQFQETLRDTDAPCFKLFFGKNRKSIPSGTGHQMRIRVLDATTYKNVLPYEATSTKHDDYSVFQLTNWTFGEQKMEFDERVIRQNQGGAQIVDMMKIQRSAKQADLIFSKEDQLTGIMDSATDDRRYWGLPYWLRTLDINVADPTGAFAGKRAYFRDGTNSLLRAGIDLSTTRNGRLPNFAGTYSGYIDEAFFDLLRRALTRTAFSTFAELEGEAPASSAPADCWILASHDNCDQWIKRINKGPDDQQGDTERFQDPQFRGVKVMRVPTLGNYAYSPIYGIKRSKIHGIVLGDMWLKETEAVRSPSQLQTWVRGIHDTSNLTMDECRSGGFVLHTVRTAA